MEPQICDAVLGGNHQPAPGAMTLGTGKLYGELFDQFNHEAKACNEQYLRLQISPRVALVRKRRAQPLDDIKIKVLQTDGYPFWIFAGYLKHDGLLLGHTAKYDPARCEKELREIVLKALREAK